MSRIADLKVRTTPRQLDREAGAARGGVLDAYLSAVQFHEVFHDRQA
jgi:hypothetical protein